MSTWIKLLPLEINEIKPDDYIEPAFPLEKRDHEVGAMTDELKKLYTLWRLVEKEAAQTYIEFKYSKTHDDSILMKSVELRDKSEILKELFWVSLKDEFKLWAKDVGVRKGYIVVWFENEEQSPGDILRGLFGRGE